DFTRGIQIFLQCVHGVVIRARKLGIECEFSRSARTIVITDDDIGSSARNVFVDSLTNLWLERCQIARQIDDDVALLPVYGIELDAELGAVVVGLAAAVSGHRSHVLELSFNPNAAAAASTSLSPRPEQFTITICSRFMLDAFLTR